MKTVLFAYPFSETVHIDKPKAEVNLRPCDLIGKNPIQEYLMSVRADDTIDAEFRVVGDYAEGCEVLHMAYRTRSVQVWRLTPRCNKRRCELSPEDRLEVKFHGKE